MTKKSERSGKLGKHYAGITRREFTRRTAALGVSTAFAGTVGGVTGIFSESAKASPKTGGHLRLGMAQGNTSDTLDPALMVTEATNLINYNCKNFLAETDHNGALVPELAESWEADGSPLRWVYNLRKGISFHDGKSFSAEDVIGTINYHISEESKSALRSILKNIQEMKADSSHRIIFTLAEPNAHFPFLMTSLPIDSIKDGKPYDFRNGTGSYVLKEFEPGIRTIFERDPNKWEDHVGFFDSAEAVPLIDTASRQNALVTGEVDLINRPDRKTWKRLASAKGVVVVQYPGRLHRTWPMHVDTAPYDNNDVRLALKYAVDRDELNDKILSGTGSVGNDHPISPAYAYFNSELPQRTYDPDKAKFHLKKAGMDNLTVTLSTSEGIWPGAVDAATLYSESAAKAGIDLKINKVPNDGYWANIWLKHPFCASYWSGRPTEDWMFTSGYAAGGSWNESRWAHPRFNELLKAARGELDENKAREMYWEMQQLCSDEGSSVIPLFADWLDAHSDKLAHGELKSNRELDGLRPIRRWWFV